MLISKEHLPADITVTYDIHYGRHGRKPQRHLSSVFSFRMPLTEEPNPATFWNNLEPERDEPLPRRGRGVPEEPRPAPGPA
jgi:hypothetical protein